MNIHPYLRTTLLSAGLLLDAPHGAGKYNLVTALFIPTGTGAVTLQLEPFNEFDFLGCHLRKRLSGPIWEKERRRVYFLQGRPSQRSMKRVRQRVKELTPRARCHDDVREVIADLNPVLRGWGNYFGTGNASNQFIDIDRYVWRRLKNLRLKRAGRQLQAGVATRWTEDYFVGLGLHRLRGTVRYPELTECRFPREHR